MKIRIRRQADNGRAGAIPPLPFRDSFPLVVMTLFKNKNSGKAA